MKLSLAVFGLLIGSVIQAATDLVITTVNNGHMIEMQKLSHHNEGKCGMWVDATIADSFITDPKQGKVADKVAFAQAPSAVTAKGANWL